MRVNFDLSRRRMLGILATLVAAAGLHYTIYTESQPTPDDHQPGRIILLSGGGVKGAQYDPNEPSAVILPGQEDNPLKADYDPRRSEEEYGPGPLLTIKGIRTEAERLKYNVFMYAYNYTNGFYERVVPEFDRDLQNTIREDHITHMAIFGYSYGAQVVRAEALKASLPIEKIYFMTRSIFQWLRSEAGSMKQIGFV